MNQEGIEKWNHRITKEMDDDKEDASIWDYIDKGMLIRVTLIIIVIIGLILALFYAGILDGNYEAPIEPHMHP